MSKHFRLPVLKSNPIKSVSGIEARISAAIHVIATINRASLVVITPDIGLTIEKYFSMLMAVSVKREQHSKRMFINPFKWHKLSPNIQSREMHVIIENGIHSKATPMSAHARFRINMFVCVRSLDDRKIVAMSVALPNMASSMMTPSAEARTKYSVPGSCAACIIELSSWDEFSLGRLRFDTTILET